MTAPSAFIQANTVLMAPPLTPEIRLHLATELLPIWQATEEELAQRGVPPPFWAFAWAGGQALARYVLDHPDVVRGKRVLDFGAGSGLAAIAAAKAGAAEVTGADIDVFAVAAMTLNARANDVNIQATSEDLLGQDAGWDTVLIADMCYEQALASKIDAWMRELTARGALVLLGDPRRTYFPQFGVEALAAYEVQTTRELEDREIRRTGVYRVQDRAA